MPNIRNRAAMGDHAWDWGFLNEAFGNTGIRVSDVDGDVERRGHVLLMEGKPADWTWSQGNGQFRKLKQYAHKPGIAVAIWYGDGTATTPRIERVELVLPSGPWHAPRIDASTEDVVRYVRRWFVHADRCEKDPHAECRYTLEVW